MPRKENNSFTRFVGGCSEVCLTMWADSVGDRSLEHYSLGLEASEVHTDDLARLEHPQNHPTLPEVKRKRRAQTCRDGL